MTPLVKAFFALAFCYGAGTVIEGQPLSDEKGWPTVSLPVQNPSAEMLAVGSDLIFADQLLESAVEDEARARRLDSLGGADNDDTDAETEAAAVNDQGLDAQLRYLDGEDVE